MILLTQTNANMIMSEMTINTIADHDDGIVESIDVNDIITSYSPNTWHSATKYGTNKT